MNPPDGTVAGIVGAVHANVRHDSAAAQVTGTAQYIDDLQMLPGTLEVAFVKSPYAHAAIVSIDSGRARQAPGVLAVLTAADIPGTNDVGPVFPNEPVLADGVVEHVGHPVAIIAAETWDQAQAAAALVDVVYEEKPAILSIEAALEAEQFTYPPPAMLRGDHAGALVVAPHRVAGEVRCGGQDHFYLETQVVMAIPREGRQFEIICSTQHPSEAQHSVAQVLGLSLNAVTVEVRRMGGAFGGKESQASIYAALAALAADATGRPVKIRLRRDDDMVITGKRHDYLIRYEAGFDDDGRIEAVDLVLACRSGNVADLTPGVLSRSLCQADNCYYLPNVRFRGFPCKTNTVSNTAFRGFGGPQGMLAIETVIEHVARHLGREIEDIRAVNYYGVGERDVSPYGQKITDNNIVPIADRLKREIGYAERVAAVREFNASHAVLKKGIALIPIKFGVSFNIPTLNQAGAIVHVYTDGSVHLNHGGTEMGQGLFTKVAQVVATVFQIDVDRIGISATRTDKVPNTSPTAASAGSDLNGMAALAAAETIKGRMTKVAADHFGVAPEAIAFRNNRVYAGNDNVSFAELAQMTWAARESLSATGFYKTPGLTWDPATMTGSPFYYYVYGAAVAEIVIDTLTGESRVLRADLLADCGNSLNPALDVGQIEGAFVQGQGWLTSEELVWDAEGRLLTHGPSTYKIPGSRDVPPELNVHLLEDAPNRVPTIFRSKAVGEPPLLMALSVWLALRDAVAGIADYRLLPKLDAPATPEAILTAIEDIRVRNEATPANPAGA